MVLVTKRFERRPV